MPEHDDRQFAAKVQSFSAGYAKVKHLEYDVIGSLDGDVSFDGDYFLVLLQKLADDVALGVVGTPFVDSSIDAYDYRFASIDHVSGFCQLFRRKCFEDIGGYMPVKTGGVDLIAVTAARMKGWKTRTYTNKVCLHRRGMGTADNSLLQSRFRQGIKDYLLGNHPLWELPRAVYQMTRRPLFLGGLLLLFGYSWALIRHAERPVSRELVAFRRREQMDRLKSLLAGGKTLGNRRLQPTNQARAD
jgi:hypothetical protein